MYRSQIEKQISGSMALLEIENDTLFLDMLAVMTKKVPVKPRAEMNLGQNYLLDGKLRATPDSISITGPEDEIDTIGQVRTRKITLPDLTSDFTEEVEIFKSKELKNTTYSESTAILSGKVVRFSEKIIKLPISILNLPDSLEIKTFPDKVSVVCKAKTERLKTLTISDFQVVGDYDTLKGGTSDELKIKLQKKPKGLHSARLKESAVEYIVKKQ
jgi:YbbR domain-containing protein